jgi:hypothetical protein
LVKWRPRNSFTIFVMLDDKRCSTEEMIVRGSTRRVGMGTIEKSRRWLGGEREIEDIGRAYVVKL